jgi:hypothetical protein
MGAGSPSLVVFVPLGYGGPMAEVVETKVVETNVISIWFDPIDAGDLRRRVSYERSPAE